MHDDNAQESSAVMPVPSTRPSTRLVRVTGTSMAPFLRAGDTLVVGVTTRRPRAGDVVVVELWGRPVVHRVVLGRPLVQTGDAGGAVTRFAPRHVVGVVQQVHRDGVTRDLTTPVARLLARGRALRLLPRVLVTVGRRASSRVLPGGPLSATEAPEGAA